MRVASAAYQPEPKAAAAARRFVRDTLQDWVVTGAADGHGLVDDAVLLTSELVTNAVVHAGTPVQVTCRLSGGAVEVVVSDGHPGRLVPEAPEREAVTSERTGGRGLLLPAALASAWGVAYGRASKAVWFRLALDGAGGGLAGGPGDDDDAASELADAIGITAALAAALQSPEGQYRSELIVERGSQKRVLASNRVIARNENNQPEFLIALFDDVTDRRSLSRELENNKKFLELVVDNIPVSLIVERVSDGRYLLANRSAEAILNRRREDATGLTAADIFNPKEAKLIIARDEAAIRKRGLLTEEHPISTKDGLDRKSVV